MKRVAFTIVMLAAVVLVARAQSPAISGRVVNDESGDPIPNARVALTTTAPIGASVVLTDGDGRFTFAAPADRQSVVPSRSGYARSEATPVRTGQPIEIRLRRAATISGRVVDEFGDPAQNIRVAVEKPSSASRSSAAAPPGPPPPPGSPAPSNAPAIAFSTTDDRGEYRITGLAEGTYVVATTAIRVQTLVVVAGSPVPPGPSIAKVYYPDADTASEAEALRVRPGEDRSDIDFVIPADIAHSMSGPIFQMGPLARDLAPVGTRATAVVRGRVVDTGLRSVPHADVRILSQATMLASRTARADRDGRFEFVDVPAGRFRVVAAKPGYESVPLPGEEGALLLFTGGVIFDLGEGETRENVDIKLRRYGTLAGRVFDENGDPMEGASVQLLHVQYEAGRRRLVPAGGASRLTDDLGRYRLFSIPAGRYIVSASVGGVASAELPGYSRSYYPGTPDAGKAPFVTMSASQDLAGIDFTMSRTRTARVSGRLLNAAGEPTTGGTVQLLPSQRSTTATSVPSGARMMPDGRFEFPNVPAGQYVIQAYRGRNNRKAEGEFGALPVVVNGTDVTGLVLQTSTGSSITGRITFDNFDRSNLPSPSAIEISALPVDFDQTPQNNFAIAEIQSDWTFEMTGVNGPRRLQLIRTPSQWTVKAIRVNGVDATDRPLPFGRADQSLTGVEVVLTDRLNDISGSITDDRARPAPGASVIVFPMARDRWYPASRYMRVAASAGADATFALTGLPYGSYYAAAVAQLPNEGPGDNDAWQDPAYLESLIARSSTVTLSDGQKLRLNLRITAR